ncbi:MAG: hypothetical protein LQ341_002132 [Variospora aurantia]|nr:MAG: hypothetical protein LQ341_002132 [Variospora aurantia]
MDCGLLMVSGDCFAWKGIRFAASIDELPRSSIVEPHLASFLSPNAGLPLRERSHLTVRFRHKPPAPLGGCSTTAYAPGEQDLEICEMKTMDE